MSVQGPSSPTVRPVAPATTPVPGTVARVASAAAPRASAPPESSLWELLTEDERAFFSQQASLGALTYGRARAAAPAPAAPLGQRLDVRG
jgi:hypothetical protein